MWLFFKLPAVLGATLWVFSTAGTNGLHAVPAPQQWTFGSMDQTVPVFRHRHRTNLWTNVKTNICKLTNVYQVSSSTCSGMIAFGWNCYNLPEQYTVKRVKLREQRSSPEESSCCVSKSKELFLCWSASSLTTY